MSLARSGSPRGADNRGMAALQIRPLDSRRRRRDWVSKSDLISFLRCPYAFWQIDSGALAPADAIDELGTQLIDDGREFHEMVESQARPATEEASLSELLADDVTLMPGPLVENRELKILGAPDGVVTACGAALPLKVKSHREARRTDELELAFYWLLLEPLRTRQIEHPRGRLILRRDDEPAIVDVDILPARFDEVRRLLRAIRAARRNGVRPRVCGCAACRGPLREEVRRLTRGCRDLTLIWGIGRPYATALEELGVADYEDLIACEPEAIVSGLRDRRYCVSAAEVERWSRHAESYRDARPIAFAPAPPVGDAFIALDLEYDSTMRHVWLIGVELVDGDHREHVSLWADTPRQEGRQLRTLADLIDDRPGRRVLTWAGHCADIPELRLAARRHRLGDALDSVFERHLDLYSWARGALRLPIPEFTLSEVGNYFGVPKFSNISGGLEAQMRYRRYLLAADTKERTALRAELIAYNRDDLEGLVSVLPTIQALAGGVRISP